MNNIELVARLVRYCRLIPLGLKAPHKSQPFGRLHCKQFWPKPGGMQSFLRGTARSLLLISMMISAWPQLLAAEDRKTLNGGWSHFAPYSYIEIEQGFPLWKGLDIELVDEIANRAGYSVTFPDARPWFELLRDLEHGEVDILASATRTRERETFAYFSDPYRYDTVALIVASGMSESLPATTDTELIDLFREKKFRLGAVAGTAFPSKAVRSFLADPANSHQVILHESPQDVLESLLDGQVDGYFGDRIVAATFVRANGAGSRVEEHPLLISGDIHLMFSKASVAREVVANFNRAIKSVGDDGTFGRINEHYAFPILVTLTLDSRWFLIVDIIGTIAFALSGLLLAIRYDYDIFGAVVLASLPAVGGGVIRDLLTNREELAVLSNPIYIEIIALLVVGGFLLIRVAEALRKRGAMTAAFETIDRQRGRIGYVVQVSDAVGLAAFTVTGVVVAVGTQSSPLWLWGPILAACTSAGGGILRDVVRSDPEVPTLKGELYPEIALVWGGILSVFMIWQTQHLHADEITAGFLATFVGAFLTRIATIHYGIRSPLFSLKP